MERSLAGAYLARFAAVAAFCSVLFYILTRYPIIDLFALSQQKATCSANFLRADLLWKCAPRNQPGVIWRSETFSISYFLSANERRLIRLARRQYPLRITPHIRSRTAVLKRERYSAQFWTRPINVYYLASGIKLAEVSQRYRREDDREDFIVVRRVLQLFRHSPGAVALLVQNRSTDSILSTPIGPIHEIGRMEIVDLVEGPRGIWGAYVRDEAAHRVTYGF